MQKTSRDVCLYKSDNEINKTSNEIHIITIIKITPINRIKYIQTKTSEIFIRPWKFVRHSLIWPDLREVILGVGWLRPFLVYFPPPTFVRFIFQSLCWQQCCFVVEMAKVKSRPSKMEDATLRRNEYVGRYRIIMMRSFRYSQHFFISTNVIWFFNL